MRIRALPAVATLSTAALLVVGLDYATLAVNGESLILGQRNHAGDTTSLLKAGPGPALRLSTRGNSRPSFTVSSPARVRRLNADMLDGASAKDLESKAITYRAGTRGTDYQGMAVWDTPVRPGLYLVSFRVGLGPSVQNGPAFEVICGVADLNTVSSTTPNIYTAESGTNSGQGVPTLMSGADTTRVTRAARPGIVCVRPSDGGEFVFFASMRVSFTKVNARVHKDAQLVEQSAVPRWLR